MTFKSDNLENSIGDNFADLITRVDKIPLEKVVETAAQYNCSQQFGSILYLFSTEMNIDPELILSDFYAELKRLADIGNPRPEIETYMYNFALEEGKWIAFLRGSLFNSLREDIKSIHSSFNKLGKLSGSDLITLATQLMMERQFISANKLIPIFEKWKENHEEATDFDAAIRILASLLNQPFSDKLKEIIVEAKKELISQIELLGDILTNAEQSNWIIRALIEVEILFEDINQPIEEMTSKALADILIWILSLEYEKNIGDFTTKQDIGKIITRFQLESALGLSTATPQAKLEYNLLSLSYKDELAKKKLSDRIIIEAWKESLLLAKPLEIGREILAMLMDYSNLPSDFLSKVPRHFEFVTTYYQADKMRLNRGLERIKIKGSKPTESEMLEAVILDYLIQFVDKYITGKMSVELDDLNVPDEVSELDLSIAEKDIVNMIDAAVHRGIRTKDKIKATQILETQVLSFYQRLLTIIPNEISVGETIIYGIFNNNNIKITRERAREVIMDHLTRMNVSIETSGKKRLDSVIQKVICLEITNKIIERELK
ncbi:MAG: hypothetical protein JXA54_07925 [Candidatus Heimdallarchaeota archaeon]|nr:hypothetical protein [Candidatus Heimdallarchaeota archaeon]